VSSAWSLGVVWAMAGVAHSNADSAAPAKSIVFM
jgi:hypothetical protein